MLDEVHPNLFLRNLFTGLSRFIPTLFFGHITAMHRGHFSTMDSNADRIVFKVASTNILCRAITDSFSLTYFDALTKTVLHTCSRTCLHCWVFLNRLSSTIDGNTECIYEVILLDFSAYLSLKLEQFLCSFFLFLNFSFNVLLTK